MLECAIASPFLFQVKNMDSRRPEKTEAHRNEEMMQSQSLAESEHGNYGAYCELWATPYILYMFQFARALEVLAAWDLGLSVIQSAHLVAIAAKSQAHGDAEKS